MDQAGLSLADRPARTAQDTDRPRFPQAFDTPFVHPSTPWGTRCSVAWPRLSASTWGGAGIRGLDCPEWIVSSPMARRSLRPELNRIRAWVRQGRTDAWIAHQLEVTVQQIQTFKNEHGLAEGAEGEALGVAAG